LLLDEISHSLHQHGHEVRMLLQLGNLVITGQTHTHTCTQKTRLHDFPSHHFLMRCSHFNLHLNDFTFQLNSPRTFRRRPCGQLPDERLVLRREIHRRTQRLVPGATDAVFAGKVSAWTRVTSTESRWQKRSLSLA